ncbi:MAG: hypothetical protein A2V77_22510 [Anaeromyxobacter sp. RBG_16_69_14]|nr:MAG: hypothetical protein A2V77_22510 [Anaeromyxobacter sp. RBG_16_69_14]
MRCWLLLAAAVPTLATVQVALASHELIAQNAQGGQQPQQPDAGPSQPERPAIAPVVDIRAIKRCKVGCVQRQQTCVRNVSAKTKRCFVDTLDECKRIGCPCSVWLQPYQLEQCQRACSKCAVKKKQEADVNCIFAQESKTCTKDETDCRRVCEESGFGLEGSYWR